MNTADLMQAMADAGAPLDAIIMAVRAIDAKDAEIRQRDEEKATKRAQDAARKREERAIKSASMDSPRTVLGDGADRPLNDIYSKPPALSDDKPARTRKRAVAPAVEIEVPDWVPAEPWAEFVAMRATKKKPVNAYIAGKQIEKLGEIRAAGWDLAKVLDKSTVNLWTSVFMPVPGRDDDLRASSSAKPKAEPRPPELEEAYQRHLRGDLDLPGYMAIADKYRPPPAPAQPRRMNGSGPRDIGSIMGKMNIPAHLPEQRGDEQAEAVG